MIKSCPVMTERFSVITGLFCATYCFFYIWLP